MKEKEIDGKIYCVNAAGNLVPKDQVRAFDQLRDQTVVAICERIKTLQQEMSEAKRQCMEDIDAFLELSAERYGVKLGGVIGNLSLTSYDGSQRVVRSIAKTLVFDEGINAAKQLIDEFLADKVASSGDKDLTSLISSAFRLRQGRLDVRRMMELRTYDISDPRWVKAMDIINQSLQVSSTKPLLQVQERMPEGGYVSLVLNFSTM